jgi:hypothetical protein
LDAVDQGVRGRSASASHVVIEQFFKEKSVPALSMDEWNRLAMRLGVELLQASLDRADCRLGVGYISVCGQVTP